MTAAEKKAKWSSRRKWTWTIGTDVGIVVGYLMTGGVSNIYSNFLLLMHIYCWLQVFGGVLMVAIFLFMNKLIEKIGTDTMSPGSEDGSKAREFVKALLQVKAMRMRWINKVYKGVIQLGTLVFIGLIMGHWSLFVAYGLSWFAGLMITASATHAYDTAPTEWKGEDTTGDGVPDEEAEMLEQAGMNPIQLAFQEAKEKKAEAARKKTESTENLVDSMMENDL
jgi:hypothetical protein